MKKEACYYREMEELHLIRKELPSALGHAATINKIGKHVLPSPYRLSCFSISLSFLA
jgi:hypothetical protein